MTQAQVGEVSRGAGNAVGEKAVCFTYWLRGHNNPSYVELFARLGAVVDFRKVMFSRQRVVSAMQYRLWTALSERAIYPSVFRRLGRRYSTLFTVDPRQIPHWGKDAVVDMNDPNYDVAMLRLLNQPQVKAIVVSTERTKETLDGLGVAAPVHIIPQIVSVWHDAAGTRAVRERYRKGTDIVVGYLAPTLTTTRDGPQRWRRGIDDLDLLLEAVERARKTEPRIKVWLLGVPSASLKRYATEKPWVTLFGYVPPAQIFNYVANFDIGAYGRTLVLPRGSFSVKLVQYMACGLPIVSTAVEEALMVEDARCGIVCRTEKEFADALLDLAQSPQSRERLGAPGREYVKPHTDWSHLPHYERIVRDVVRRNH